MKKNVRSYPDIYTYKMLVESVQILSSAYYFTNQSDIAPYKLTHQNHPVCVWCRQSLSNWQYLYNLALHIYDEYMYRYDKSVHKSGDILLNMIQPDLKDVGLTEFPQCFDDKYKCDNVVEGYRNYFNAEKQHLMKYKNRKIPDWVLTSVG